MKISYFSLLVLLLFSMSFIAFSQTIAITEDGKKVLLNKDGTWKYIDPPVTKNTTNDVTDCDNYIYTEVDKVTGTSTLVSKNKLIISTNGGKNGFGIIFMKVTSGVIAFSIQAVGAGNCIDDENKMNVLFRDGTRLELKNDGKFNCDGKFTLYFLNLFDKKQELDMFKTKEIETMRVWTSKGHVEENFSPNQSKEFINIVNCLAKE